MSTRSLPPALEPYLRLPPEASLILLTGTLGCSVNWLTCRFISSALSTNPEEKDVESNQSVILVSWLRDLPFWKSEIKRTTCLDISRHRKFHFIDCFSIHQSLDATEKSIARAIESLHGPPNPSPTKPLLILDTPTTLLTSPSTHDPSSLQPFLLTLRSQVHATILTNPADTPLLQTSTPLEAATANFLTSQAHAARFVMSVRELDTGAARDISGVLRVTRGGDDEEGEGEEEKEMLYLVQRDGNVKVFNRGE